MDTKLDEEAGKEKPRRWSLFRFVQELKAELKKVSWTTANELKLSTKIVVISTFSFGLGIYLVDLVVKGVLHTVSALFHRVFG